MQASAPDEPTKTIHIKCTSYMNTCVICQSSVRALSRTEEYRTLQKGKAVLNCIGERDKAFESCKFHWSFYAIVDVGACCADFH